MIATGVGDPRRIGLPTAYCVSHSFPPLLGGYPVALPLQFIHHQKIQGIGLFTSLTQAPCISSCLCSQHRPLPHSSLPQGLEFSEHLSFSQTIVGHLKHLPTPVSPHLRRVQNRSRRLFRKGSQFMRLLGKISCVVVCPGSGTF